MWPSLHRLVYGHVCQDKNIPQDVSAYLLTFFFSARHTRWHFCGHVHLLPCSGLELLSVCVLFNLFLLSNFRSIDRHVTRGNTSAARCCGVRFKLARSRLIDWMLTDSTSREVD